MRRLAQPDVDDADSRQKRSLPLGWLLAITATATALRLAHLDIQILGGDELHLLFVITRRTLDEIPGTVTGWDYSIPLALFFRAVSNWVPLTEGMLRAPILLCGCCTPVLVAIMGRSFVSSRVAIALAWAIAVHPFFIFYSRFVRPYAICLALILIVIWLADRWATERRARLLVSLSVVAAIACWFQPLALITVGFILGGAFVRELLLRSAADASPGSQSRPVAVVLTGLLTMALTLALYAPALGNIFERMVVQKVGSGQLTFAAVLENAEVLAGLPGTTPLVGFLLAAFCGAVLLAQRLKSRSLLLLAPLLGQPAVIVLLQPSLIEAPLVLARYQFYVLPIAWLAVCVFLCELARRLWLGAGRPWPSLLSTRHTAPAVAALLAALWIVLGPYSSIYKSDNAYAHHYLFQTFQYEANRYWHAIRHDPSNTLLHPYYSELVVPDGRAPPVIEWAPGMGFANVTFHFAQAHHGRPVKIVGKPGEWWWLDERFALHNVIDFSDPDQPPDLAPGTVVLLHKNPIEENKHFAQDLPSDVAPTSQQQRAYKRVYRRVSACLGRPVFEDRFLAAFRR